MAEGKKSFIAYSDWQEIFEMLPDDKAGQLVKHLFAYVNDENPETDDILVKTVFVSIKQTLKRDLKKYEQYTEKQRANGKKGGRPKNPEKPKKPNGLSENPTKPKKADSVSVSVNDSVSDSVNVKDIDVVDSKEIVNGKFYQINKVVLKYKDEYERGEHSQVMERVSMNLKLRKGALDEAIEEFKTHLLNEEKVHPTTLELRKHFINWLNIKDTTGQLEKYKSSKAIKDKREKISF